MCWTACSTACQATRAVARPPAQPFSAQTRHHRLRVRRCCDRADQTSSQSHSCCGGANQPMRILLSFFRHTKSAARCLFRRVWSAGAAFRPWPSGFGLSLHHYFDWVPTNSLHFFKSPLCTTHCTLQAVRRWHQGTAPKQHAKQEAASDGHRAKHKGLVSPFRVWGGATPFSSSSSSNTYAVSRVSSVQNCSPL